MGTLYLVATPIGNLEDISARALRTLREVRLIAAEDTRQTQKLLNHFEIRPAQKPLSFHAHSTAQRTRRILEELQAGDVALVSDAGTPLINDPGEELVQAAVAAGHTVCPIPGPSAPLAALTASGLPTGAFLYLGYLPRQSKERRAVLESVRQLPYTLIFLETPHRLQAALQDLLAGLGDRPAAAARELTKLHEEILRLPLSGLLAHFEAHEPRGEFTLVIAGAVEEAPTVWDAAQLDEAVQAALQSGESPSKAAARLAQASGHDRRTIYRMLSSHRDD